MPNMPSEFREAFVITHMPNMPSEFREAFAKL